jgi:hypothetical protein
MPHAPAHPSSHPAAIRPTRSGRMLRLRRALPAVAVVAALAVVGSLAVAPGSAQAAEVSIADSLSRGTLEQDIVAGRISVDELVDANLAARAAAPDLPAVSRSELTRQVTAEIQEMREHGASALEGTGPQDAAADPAADTAPTAEGSAAPGDAVSDSKLSFGKVKKAFGKVKHYLHHSTTVTVELWQGVAGAGVGMTAAALAALVCAAAGPVTCAVAMTVIAGATGAVFGLLTACVANQDRWWHVTLPDIQHSWCSK